MGPKLQAVVDRLAGANRRFQAATADDAAEVKVTMNDIRSELRKIIADPSTSDADREIAKRMLEAAGGGKPDSEGEKDGAYATPEQKAIARAFGHFEAASGADGVRHNGSSTELGVLRRSDGR